MEPKFNYSPLAITQTKYKGTMPTFPLSQQQDSKAPRANCLANDSEAGNGLAAGVSRVDEAKGFSSGELDEERPGGPRM